MGNLYQELLEYQESKMYPFHMPGHKRKAEDFVNPFLIDITEIEGFDNLHHAEGILREAQHRAARLYGAEETHYLVNGSTCGILSAISACTRRRGKILMGRNSHKSCYHGAMLQELEISYLYPQPETKLGINGGITPESVEKMLLHNQGIQAVMITSPTYDGVVSDVKEIAERVHAYGIPLIVDEAHGAHFGFHPFFPESSVKLGADIVIHSLHKTLPSLTQTALLHVNGNLVDRERLNWYLGVYQTSSPSYVFMAGMDRCVHLIENEGMQLFEKFSENLEEFYTEAAYFRKIRTVGRDLAVEAGIYDFDRSKLVLSVRNTDLDGHRLQQILRVQYQLELEMAAGSYGLAITSILDSKEGFKRMLTALGDIDIQCRGAEESPLEDTVIRNTTVMSVFEALEEEKEAVQIKNAGGRIAGEFIYLYPPGIPLLVPGERIGKELAERLQKFRKHGYSLQGLADYNGCDIRVMK